MSVISPFGRGFAFSKKHSWRKLNCDSLVKHFFSVFRRIYYKIFCIHNFFGISLFQIISCFSFSRFIVFTYLDIVHISRTVF